MWLPFNPDRLSRATISPKEDLESSSGRADPRLNVQHVTQSRLHACGHLRVKGLAHIFVIMYAYTWVKCCYVQRALNYVPVITGARSEESSNTQKKGLMHRVCDVQHLLHEWDVKTSGGFISPVVVNVVRRPVKSLKRALLLFQHAHSLCHALFMWPSTVPIHVRFVELEQKRLESDNNLKSFKCFSHYEVKKDQYFLG